MNDPTPTSDPSLSADLGFHNYPFNALEYLFAETFGMDRFLGLYNRMADANLLEKYAAARDTPSDLFLFGWTHGILSIVAFCYCKLRLQVPVYHILMIATTKECMMYMEHVVKYSRRVFKTVEELEGTTDPSPILKFDPTKRQFYYTIVDKNIDYYHLLDDIPFD